MVYKKMIVLVLTIATSISCTSIYWNVKKDLRKPGEKMLEHPNKVWEKYQCAQEKVPLVQIVKYEVVPPEVSSGKEINQHFEYIFCPAKPAQTLRGVLIRRIYFRGRVIFEDKTKDFEIKPGKWGVDAFITVPPNAEPGIYFLEVQFRGKGLTLKKGQNFVVKVK